MMSFWHGLRLVGTLNKWFGIRSVLILPAVLWAAPLAADELQVAVAANFLGTLQKLAPQFEKETRHKLLLSGGSSGALYNQIAQGAPFDIFLAADSERPKKLEDEGLAVPDSRFTYAIGKLVLWSPKAGLVDEGGDVLKSEKFQFLAIADSKVAPYGAAAQQVINKLGLWERLNTDKKIVAGDSIAQALQFVISGNADLAFVAWSQLVGDSEKMSGSLWLPPQTMYDRITQDAVILKRTEHAAAAAQFMRWLHSDARALTTIKQAGYTLK